MNQLNVSLQHSIATLAANGWSARKIARELGVHRETVGRYLRPPQPDSKPAIPPPGSRADSDSKPAIVPAGSKAGRTSHCAPVTVVIDNLKAGVIQADWFDPQLNPKLEEFARHYGTVILPTRPAMPRHKGKVEAGVKYAQNNAVKGRNFESLAAQNLFLSEWEKNVADTRIHGTTRQQVGKLFETVERPALQALPTSLFPVFEEAQRTVHRDGYVEFKRAYYSTPPEYVGRQVWVRQESRLLRIHNTRREQIALHALAEPGKFTTDPAHLHSRKRHIIERGADYLLDRCRLIGPLTGTWAQAMHQNRGPQSLRVMLGLLQLAEKHPAAELEKAAGIATHHGAWRLRDLKRLLALPGHLVLMDFLESLPVIRSFEA